MGAVQLNRIPPRAGPGAYKTYGWSAPLATHWRVASCVVVDCEPYRNGWTSTADVGTELGQQQAHYMRHDRSRSCREEQISDRLVAFVYPPGNRCFLQGEHRAPVGRPALFSVADGDWRGNPTGNRRVHSTAEAWVEDFTEHQDRLVQARQRLL